MPSLASQRALQAAIDRLTPVMRRQVERALAKLSGRVSQARLIEAVSGRDELLFRALMVGLSRDLAPAVDTVRQAFVVGGRYAAKGVSIAFNATRPLAARAAEQLGATLITGVTTQTRDAIRSVIAESFRVGLSPRDTAALIKPLIGLTERQGLAVIAKRQQRVASGWTEQRAQQESTRYAAKLLKARAEMIARTELQKAATEGQLTAWRQAQQEGQLASDLRKTWIVTPDDRLCPVCAPLEGQQVGIAETFSVGVAGPPVHPNCRCAIGLTTAALKRRRVA